MTLKNENTLSRFEYNQGDGKLPDPSSEGVSASTSFSSLSSVTHKSAKNKIR